jgi:hypothetical protein
MNLWIALPAGALVPSSLSHTVELDLSRPGGQVHTIVKGGLTAVSAQLVPAFGAPLSGGPWVAIYDPLLKGGHRTAIYAVDGLARIPGRLAIDFVKLPPEGSIERKPAVRPANWNGFGSDVLAVADGVVAAALDDTPDDTPPPIALERGSGNYVVLDIGGGRFVFYEHLQRGSVAVKAGQRVRRGQIVARLGSSGSTSIGPHLHFHVADRDSLLAAEGMPFVFETFVQLGGFASLDAVVNGEKWSAAARERRMTAERPAPNTVLQFPGR